jgi:aldehyde dehydrogenase (NAD+)
MNIAIIERLASAGRLDRIFIGGTWVRPAGQDRSVVIDPSTEEPVAEIAMGNAQDVAVAVAEARRAFTTWSLSSPHSRAALLDRIHGLILERTESFAQAISQEMGCAISVARAAQVPIAAEHVRVARDLAGSYPFVTHRGSTAIMREAIGVCGLITPWNWPLYQITAEGGSRAGGGMHRRLEAQRAVAPERHALRGSDARRWRSGGCVRRRCASWRCPGSAS